MFDDKASVYSTQDVASTLHCEEVPDQCAGRKSSIVTYLASVDGVGDARQVRLSAINIQDQIFNLPFEPTANMTRNGWLYGEGKWHYAIDYYTVYPTPFQTFRVGAAAPGTMIHIGWENAGGNTVIISHDANGVVDAYRTIYHHLRNGAVHDCHRSWSSVPSLKEPDLSNYQNYLKATQCNEPPQAASLNQAYWGTNESLDMSLVGRKVDAGQFLGRAGETGTGGYNHDKLTPNTHLHVFWVHRDPADKKWYLFDPYGIYGKPECYPWGINDPLNTPCVQRPVAFEGSRPQYPLLPGLAADSWGRDRIDIFARGADDSLSHRSFANGWSQWESLGGVLGSAPAASSWGAGRLDVFVRGGDNMLWHKWYDLNGWSVWEIL